jgi:hypothetical protein
MDKSHLMLVLVPHTVLADQLQLLVKRAFSKGLRIVEKTLEYFRGHRPFLPSFTMVRPSQEVCKEGKVKVKVKVSMLDPQAICALKLRSCRASLPRAAAARLGLEIRRGSSRNRG